MSGRDVVLVMVKGLGIGGAEKLIATGAPFWDRDRFEYHVAYVLPWKDHLVTDLTNLGIPVHLLGSGRDPDPAAGPNLRRLIREIDARLVHAHLPSAGVIARLVSPVPVVYTEHNLADSYRFPTRLANFLTYGRNRAVLAVSEAVAASVARYPGPPPTLIPNGVSVRADPVDVLGVRRELGIDDDTPLVVHVGNIRPHKGHATLIAATERLRKLRPEAVVVSIGGEKHPGDLSRLKTEVTERGLNGTLRFLGSRADALSFVAAAQVFVNPADVEGLPVAVLEAMALGTPVVATAVGGVPSVILDEETGLLCPPGEALLLAERIDSMLGDPHAGLMAQRGKELVEREHGLGPMVRRVEDVYREVLDG